MNKLLKKRDYYKPFSYPFAYEAYQLQNKIHWLPEEINLREDVSDWNNISKEEKNLLTQIFRFFTQADINVAKGYNKFRQIFPHPELQMMMNSFANMEAVHIDAYSLLLETVGMPEAEYKAFREFEAMENKHNYLDLFDPTIFTDDYVYRQKEGIYTVEEKEQIKNRMIAKSLAVYSAFTEGLHLFSSFVILLNFPRHNKMKGMGKIVQWSIRDETLHVESMIQLFRTFIKENKSIWTDDFKKELYEIARTMVDLEDKFIDLAFELGGVEGLKPEDVKQYVRYIADRRLLQLGLKTNFKVKHNPLKWVEEMLNVPEHTNFFENRSTAYSKGAATGKWPWQK